MDDNGGCRCKGGELLTHDLRKTLEAAELLGPFERLLDARVSSAACIASINQAERAKALKLGDAVASLYRKKAERELAATTRLVRGAKAELLDKLRNKEWKALAASITDEKNAPEASQLRAEHRERVVEALFESRLTAGDAKEALDIWDSGASALTDQGLPGLVRWLTTRLDADLKALRRPHYGRQPASPLTAAQARCIGIVTAVYLSMLAVCAWVPFCWCCYTMAITLFYIKAIDACV